MKTNKRRLLAALTATTLALTPCFAAGMMNAVAAGDIGVINITGDTSEHTYKAYPIITGEQDGNKLKNLAWATGFNATGFVAALNTPATRTSLGISAETPTISTVDDAAKVLSGITDADKLSILAELIGNYKGSTGTPLSYSTAGYTATVTDGWYLILDETDLTSSTDVKVKSSNILEVVGKTDMKAKHNLPTLDKKITSNNQNSDGSANHAAIGDTVAYEIDIKVPDVRGYDKYFYVVEDTLSAGLTYTADSLAVTIGNPATTVDPDTDGPSGEEDSGDYYVVQNGTSIKVVFKDAATYFKNKKVDDPIKITYSAVLNENAVIGDTGNPNKAKLVYSNDPSVEGNGKNEPGKPDEPGANAPTGETPEDTVKTFTTAIKIKKVDQSGNPLTGATFKLSGTGINKVKVESGDSFNEDANGTYWKLKNGTYTETDPATLADTSAYEDTTTKYKKSKLETATKSGEDTNVSVTATVDENGFLTFSGLDAGDYKLEETAAPTGYNGAAAIDFTISANVDATPVFSSNNAKVALNSDNMFETIVENRYGAQLPSTGGVGTKLFYLFGSAFVIGASTFIVTKKRVGTNK